MRVNAKPKEQRRKKIFSKLSLSLAVKNIFSLDLICLGLNILRQLVKNNITFKLLLV